MSKPSGEADVKARSLYLTPEEVLFLRRVLPFTRTRSWRENMGYSPCVDSIEAKLGVSG